MKVLKKINNNAAICEDQSGKQLIAFGTGIGFPKTPYELESLEKITHTYYGVDPKYYSLLNELPEDVFRLAEKIVRIAQELLDCELNVSLVFTLADHLSFAIERFHKKIFIANPMYHDIKHLYQAEMEVGEMAVKMVNREFNVKLPEDEAANIALYCINARTVNAEQASSRKEQEAVIGITMIIENSFAMQIDKDSFNYSRFVSHMQYLFKRQKEHQSISSDNLKMYLSMKEDFPETYSCLKEIKKYMEQEFESPLGEEEMLYLMLHVNRLRIRQDCYL